MNSVDIAIIPARGGSKRIPRKNIRPFLGKPVIGYSIEAARASGLFSEIMVSTDDEEIAAVARQLGAQVPFMRSAENSTDQAGTAEVLLEVILEYEKRGRQFQRGCGIFPAAPLITPATLKLGRELLVSGNYDTTFPVLQFSYPILRSLKLEDGRATMNWPEYYSSRSQDLPPACHDAGQFFWFDVGSFKAKPKLFTDNSGGFVIAEMDAQDIDSIEDWQLAEMKYRARQEAGRGNR